MVWEDGDLKVMQSSHRNAFGKRNKALCIFQTQVRARFKSEQFILQVKEKGKVKDDSNFLFRANWEDGGGISDMGRLQEKQV